MKKSDSAVRFRPVEDKDTGWSWFILAVAFCTQIIIFGLILCFGIYFVTLLEFFKCTKREVALIGSIAYGTKCVSGLLSSILYRKLGCRIVVMAGGLISASGCFLSYFARDLPHLAVTYGFINGFGLGLAYTPTVGILGDYFDKYRYFATAFVSVGSATGTLLFQPIFLMLIREYGWQGSMLINAGFALQIVLFGSFLKSRNINSHLKFSSLAEVSLLKDRKFLIHLLICFLWGGAIYIVFSMINALVMAEGITKTRSAMIGSVIGLSNMIGRASSSLIGQWSKTNRPLFFATITLLYSCGALAATFCSTFVGFAVSVAVFGCFFGQMLAQLAPTLIDLFGVNRLVNAIGYSVSSAGIGGFIIPFVAGILADEYGIRSAFYLSFGTGSVAAALGYLNFFLREREKRLERERELDLADI